MRISPLGVRRILAILPFYVPVICTKGNFTFTHTQGAHFIIPRERISRPIIGLVRKHYTLALTEGASTEGVFYVLDHGTTVAEGADICNPLSHSMDT